MEVSKFDIFFPLIYSGFSINLSPVCTLSFRTECLIFWKSVKGDVQDVTHSSSACVGSKIIRQLAIKSNDTGRGRKVEKRPIAKWLVRACNKKYCMDSSTPRSATISWACSLRLSEQNPSWSLVGRKLSILISPINWQKNKTVISLYQLIFLSIWKTLTTKWFSNWFPMTKHNCILCYFFLLQFSSQKFLKVISRP